LEGLITISEDYKEKITDIEVVYSLWRGSFISSEFAMYEISKIMSTDYKQVSNARIIDKNGKGLFIGEATVKMRKN